MKQAGYTTFNILGLGEGVATSYRIGVGLVGSWELTSWLCLKDRGMPRGRLV